MKDCIEQHCARLKLTLKNLVEVCRIDEDSQEQETCEHEERGRCHAGLPKRGCRIKLESVQRRTRGYAEPNFDDCAAHRHSLEEEECRWMEESVMSASQMGQAT